VLNWDVLPIGQILVPGRDGGRFLLTTSLAFKPDTNEVYIVATDGDGTRGATIFRTACLAKGTRPFSRQLSYIARRTVPDNTRSRRTGAAPQTASFLVNSSRYLEHVDCMQLCLMR
jgi:hypothetical protein